jgi:integrase
MKTLDQALTDYLALRRGLGFKLRQDERRLKTFLSFLQERGADHITSQLALEWATQSPEWRPCAAQRLIDVRGFARYLVHFDPRTEVPPKGHLRPGGRAKPYLYTEGEIRRLMDAAEALPPLDGLRRWTYSCLFGLLAVTGLRISEALNLRREDVDLAEGVLTIRGTKFGKYAASPAIPM